MAKLRRTALQLTGAFSGHPQDTQIEEGFLVSRTPLGMTSLKTRWLAR